MPGGVKRAIGRAFLLVWVGSLGFAVLLVVPALLLVRSDLATVRDALQQRDYKSATVTASRLSLPANACRIALVLPAPATFRVLPFTSGVMSNIDAICDVGYSVGRIANLQSVQQVAARLSGRDLRDVQPTEALVNRVVTAANDAEPLLLQLLADVDRLDVKLLPESGAARVENVRATWTPQRVRETVKLVDLAPTLLGFDRPRRFFFALQSVAEMRASGGFLGQYAVLEVNNGRIKLVEYGSNSSLQKPQQGVRQLRDSELITLTRNPQVANTNLSPHGPDVGALWLNVWQQQNDEELDGAIGMDVVTAARLIEADGETFTKPDGTVLRTATEIADYAQNGVYFDFDAGNRNGSERKDYQLEVMSELLGKATQSLMNVDSLFRVMPRSAVEDRLLVAFSARYRQREVSTSAVGKDLRHETNVLRITWNNWSGNKFDFYQRPSAALTCAADGLELRLDIVNTADPDRQYPAYIGQRLDEPTERRASVRDQWLFVLPAGANVRWLTVDDQVVRYEVVTLAGRPVVQVLIDTVAGQRHVVKAGIGGVRTAAVQVIGQERQQARC